MVPLSPCHHCRRHVRSGTDRCPFCGHPAPPAPTPSAPISNGASRTALVLLGAALALDGCATPPAGGGDTSIVQPYGAPIPPPRPPASGNDASIVQPYGAPVPPPRPPASGGDSTVAPPYGAAVPPPPSSTSSANNPVRSAPR